MRWAATDDAAGGHPLTGKPWRDNVLRKTEFEAANPDADISFKDGVWTGLLPAQTGGAHVWQADDLGDLLDQMENAAGDSG